MNRSLLPSDVERIAQSLVGVARRLRGQEARESVPLGTVILNRTSAQAISSTLASTTPIQWETLKAGLGFTWVIGSSTKIFSTGKRTGERFEISGSIRWDTGGTGRREAYLKTYTIGNSLRETVPLHAVVTDAGGNVTLSLSMTHEWVDPTDYFQIEVAHNQGTSLNLNFARLGAKIVR